MNEQVIAIAGRIRELREILEIPVSEMAKALDITEEQYSVFEAAKEDIPISTIFAIAAVLGVDYTVLLTGESPRMTAHCVTRRGEGIAVDRYEGYHFESLAYNFKNKIMEPMLVTLEPGREPKLVAHSGQEFNFCLTGKLRVKVGKNEFILEKGDSIYFDPRLPHGQYAMGEETKFLTVITE